MQSAALRLGSVACVFWIVPGLIASAQDREGRPPATAGAVPVFNPIEGRVTVLSTKPEGTVVQRGDLLVEVDPKPLKDRLAVEKTLVQSAEADLEGAKLAREVSELAVNEYTEGTFKRDFQARLGEVSQTDAARKLAEDQLEWSNQMVKKGYVSVGRNVADKLSLQQAMFASDEAQTAKNVYLQFTKSRRMKELKANVQQARASELKKQASLDRHKAAQASLEHQIEQCRVTAPANGRVRHGRPFGPGAVAHDGDLLLEIVPETAPAAR